MTATPKDDGGAAPEFSLAQLDILRHMLGINTPGAKEPKPYRNYFAANKDNEKLAELAALGAVRRYLSDEQYDWYTCTAAGLAAAIASHKTIRYSKAKRMYSKFLDCKDCFDGLTFRMFLTHPQFAESRRAA